MEQVLELLQVQIRWVEVKLTALDITHLKVPAELKFINHIQLSLMVLLAEVPHQALTTHHRFLRPEAALKPTILRITTI